MISARCADAYRIAVSCVIRRVRPTNSKYLPKADDVRLWWMMSKTVFSVELNPPIAAATSSELARISSAQQIYSAVLADLIAFATGKCLIPTLLYRLNIQYFEGVLL